MICLSVSVAVISIVAGLAVLILGMCRISGDCEDESVRMEQRMKENQIILLSNILKRCPVSHVDGTLRIQQEK